MSAMHMESNTDMTASVLAVASMLKRQGSRATLTRRYMSASRAMAESGFSDTPMRSACFVLHAGMRFTSSCVLPPLLMRMSTSSSCNTPRPPCTASDGVRKSAGISMQLSEWAIFFAAMAEVPQPERMTFPRQFISAFATATTFSPSSSDVSARSSSASMVMERLTSARISRSFIYTSCASANNDSNLHSFAVYSMPTLYHCALTAVNSAAQVGSELGIRSRSDGENAHK